MSHIFNLLYQCKRFLSKFKKIPSRISLTCLFVCLIKKGNTEKSVAGQRTGRSERQWHEPTAGEETSQLLATPG